ncbi:MAG: 3-phosphoshikimate 1-carboxyvinyltransferase, partial [Desulfotomaculales bacterium]
RSLRRRPMRRVTGPLRQRGATVLGRNDAAFAPLAILGRPHLKPLRYTSPVASAQVKSAILLAGLFADGYTSITEPARSRDHTERLLREFGAEIHVDGNSVAVKGRPQLKGAAITVPGDISSAAFLLAAALILPDAEITVTDVGLNPTRTGIIEVMKSMGADIEVFATREIGCEPVGNIRARSSRLVGVSVEKNMVPRLIDEIPVLAVLAAVADGVTVVCGAEELRVKESNRLTAIATELVRLGAHVTETRDGLIIKGGSSLHGATVDSYGDHRIAMALAVAGLAAQGSTTIRGAECVSISFPGFFEVLNSLRPQSPGPSKRKYGTFVELKSS